MAVSALHRLRCTHGGACLLPDHAVLLLQPLHSFPCCCLVPRVVRAAAIAVPAALAGAVVALVVSKLFGWLQRRRQRRYEQTETGSEFYEEEVLTASDQDAASAYDE